MSDNEHDIPIKVIDRRWWVNQDNEAPREDTRGSGKPTYLEDLEKQLAEKDEQIAEYLAKYRSAASEFEEARLRLRREISKDVERSRRDILSDLLEVVDNLDRAIESANPSTGSGQAPSTGSGQAPSTGSGQGASVATLLQGVEMVRRQFLAKLEGFGVTRIEADHQPFDPALHEAISSVPATTPEQDGLVVGTVRCGYRIGDDVLRPAAVAVAKL